MFIKIRRDTLIILMLAFMLIVSGRVMSYVSYASSDDTGQGVPIAGVIVKGNDIVPTATIKGLAADAGFRTGSYIQGDTLVTTKRKVPLEGAIENAEIAVSYASIPGTQIYPITAVDVKVDRITGIVTITVIEDFQAVVVK